ncbi:MAG TPA: AAA family ATPase [Methanospirillum sp.]|uniref:AAA family ATPase n=1 Tax=Methanospirillum sp. TaxID=45200 RepID=UPI002BA9428C|nr:AAA family ATPase [Methanospirillum sp.]HOJ97665.1 AAA family ATPase [Methanospirillum sp.]
MGRSEKPPHIEKLVVKNYRVLRNLELSKLTPLTIFIGPNGSGKSTIFDVFAFLSECFTQPGGLRTAWEKRGRFKHLRSRGSTEPISIEIKYREKSDSPLITYHLEIDERERGPVVTNEWLHWRRNERGRPFKFLDFTEGHGTVITGENPDESAERQVESLKSPETLAVATLGLFSKHPRVSALRDFITGWHLSYLTADNTRTTPAAGGQEHLSSTGDNLPNVIQYLMERHPFVYEEICQTLSSRIPRLSRIEAEIMGDTRLNLQIYDAPFKEPVLARFASDGTLKMLAYLVLLNDPVPGSLIGIEEPENQLHPLLLPHLAEEFHKATSRTQLLVTTHSPALINEAKPEEVFSIYRDEDGYTRAERLSDIEELKGFLEEKIPLGDLWMENFVPNSDPITYSRYQ